MTKASDIDDKEILLVVENSCIERGIWSNTTIVAEKYSEFPFKVVAAKLSKLLRRGLLTGCDCGCRGDWELTKQGREFAGIQVEWRDNPAEWFIEQGLVGPIRD